MDAFVGAIGYYKLSLKNEKGSKNAERDKLVVGTPCVVHVVTSRRLMSRRQYTDAFRTSRRQLFNPTNSEKFVYTSTKQLSCRNFFFSFAN